MRVALPMFAALAACASSPAPAAKLPADPPAAQYPPAVYTPPPRAETPPPGPTSVTAKQAAPAPTQGQARDEAAAYERAILEHAGKLGFERVIFSRGVTKVIEQLIEEPAALENAPTVAIELDGIDDGWVAWQALEGGQALYRSDYSDSILWFEPSPGEPPIIEGSQLRAIGGYVVITGVRSYPLRLGGTRQAFTVRLAWPEARD